MILMEIPKCTLACSISLHFDNRERKLSNCMFRHHSSSLCLRYVTVLRLIQHVKDHEPPPYTRIDERKRKLHKRRQKVKTDVQVILANFRDPSFQSVKSNF
jgi:hypothetical protein